MAEPFCAIWHLCRYRLVAPLDPTKFENHTSMAREIATRVGIGLGAVVGGVTTYLMPVPILLSVAALGVGSRALRAIGFALQQNGFTHVRGTAIEKHLPSEQVNLMTWNVCGIGGGLSLDHGGVIHWRARLDGIVQKIKAENPDVLVLQEIYDTALAEALIERLKEQYAHFYIHLGPNSLGSVGGCMVLSKCAVHAFSNTSFNNNSWDLNRGFASLEIKPTPTSEPCARIIGTHLIHSTGREGAERRMEQVAQIAAYVGSQKLPLPTVLMGDLNTERDQYEATRALDHHVKHCYTGPTPTCTNELTAQWEGKPAKTPSETIDYISLFSTSKAELNRSSLVEAFDKTYNTKTALSDHHGIVATLDFSSEEYRQKRKGSTQGLFAFPDPRDPGYYL